MSPAPVLTSYFNPEAMLSVLVPVGWDGEIVDATTFRIKGPAHPEFDRYRPTMSWSRHPSPAPGDDWIDALAASTLADARREYEEFTLQRERRVMTSDYVPLYARWYSWTDPTSGLAFSQIQAFLAGESLWLINAATLIALAAVHLPLFETILDSTRIIPARPQ